jgi:hypothetical protein
VLGALSDAVAQTLIGAALVAFLALVLLAARIVRRHDVAGWRRLRVGVFLERDAPSSAVPHAAEPDGEQLEPEPEPRWRPDD